MVKTLKGKFKKPRTKIAIVCAEFNDFISKRSLDACLKELKKAGLNETDITVAWVPGSFEIPVAALKFAKKKTVGAVICLGAVIRGETQHFHFVADGCARGIAQTSLTTGKPVIFCVLTTETVNQAYKRSQVKGDNRGRDAAVSALEMIDLLSQIN